MPKWQWKHIEKRSRDKNRWHPITACRFLHCPVPLLNPCRLADLVHALLVSVFFVSRRLFLALGSGLAASFHTSFQFPGLAELWDPFSVDVFKPIQKVGIPTTKLPYYRSLLNAGLARGHGRLGNFRTKLAHDGEHVSA